MNNQTTQLPNRYEVDPTLPPIVIVYTRKDGIEKSWVVRPTYNELLDVVNEMGDSLEIAVNVGPARRSLT